MTILMLSTSSASGQTVCKNDKGTEGQCVTEKLFKAEVGRGVTKTCAEHEADSKRVDAHRKTAKTAEGKLNVCKGEKGQIQRQLDLVLAKPVGDPWRSPAWLRGTLDVSLVGLGVATGLSIGAKLPRELSVGLAVGAGAALVGRLILERLDFPRRKKRKNRS